jgi:GST-like protein
MDVLDRHLAGNAYMAGDDYSIADIAIWPWYGWLVQGKLYQCAEFLQVHTYENLARWTAQIAARPAVIRGSMVNRMASEPSEQLRERHDAKDLELHTQSRRGSDL